MDEQDGAAGAFIHVVHPTTIYRQEVVGKRVFPVPVHFRYQVRLIIAALSPLPMPISATCSPVRIRPESAANASVSGTAAGPTFPKVG